MIDPLHIESLLKFLCVQQPQWQTAVERTVLASVRALYFLHRIRFGGLPYAERPGLESEHSDSADEDDMDRMPAKRLPCRDKAGVSHDCTDSDSPDADNLAADLESRQPKRPRPPLVLGDASTGTMAGHTSAATTNDHTTRRTPSFSCRIPGLARRSTCGRIAKRHSRKSAGGKTKPAAQSVPRPDVHAGLDSPDTRPRPARKRWRHTITTDAAGLGGPDQRPAKQHRRALSHDPQAALWTRWRQLEPCRRKRT